MSEVLDRREISAPTPTRRIEPDAASSTGSHCRTSAARSANPRRRALLDVLSANRLMLVELSRGVVGCASLAEDVVHDVCVKLADFRDQDAVRQPVAYVSRLVRNASVDAVRRQSDEHACQAEQDGGGYMPSPELSPEAALQVRDTLRHVFDALAQLPPRCRAAFEMVRLREETLQSTARALNVSQTLVHFLVRDAEKHCAACLDTSHRGGARPASGVGRVAPVNRRRP